MFSRDVMLADHLRYNFVPPISHAIGCAKKAIAAIEAGEPDREIETPSGNMMAAYEIIDQLRLDGFIESDQNGR